MSAAYGNAALYQSTERNRYRAWQRYRRPALMSVVTSAVYESAFSLNLKVRMMSEMKENIVP